MLLQLLASVLLAGAAYAVLHFPTPIDASLPLLCLVVSALALIARRPSIQIAAVALIAAEIAIPDERLRLMAFGLVMAACFWTAAAEPPLFVRGTKAVAAPAHSKSKLALIVALAVFVIRFLPLRDVRWSRAILEIVVITAIAAFLRATIPLLVVLFILVAVFPWSGAFFRGFAYFVKAPRPVLARQIVAISLAPSQSLDLDVPPDTHTLIVSGANVPRLRSGTVIGRIEPGGQAIRIGDTADWGFMRKEHWLHARNPVPRDPAGKVRDYGWSSWIDGAGRITLPPGAKHIRVTADAHLAPNARLQVDAFELEHE